MEAIKEADLVLFCGSITSRRRKSVLPVCHQKIGIQTCPERIYRNVGCGERDFVGHDCRQTVREDLVTLRADLTCCDWAMYMLCRTVSRCIDGQ